jgi:hypothetical protein
LTDYQYVQFGTEPGLVNFYFYVPPTVTLLDIGGSFFDPDDFAIYQGSVEILRAYNSAVSLTGDDIAFLTGSTVPGNFFAGIPIAAGNLGRPSSGFVNGSGKLTWNHNPALGTQYTIVSTRQSLYDHWMYAMQYPSAFGQTVVASPTATTASYSGHMDMEPNTLLLGLTPPGTAVFSGVDAAVGIAPGGTNLINGNTLDYTTIGVNLATYASRPTGGAQVSHTYVPQSFSIVCYGLMPGTSHEFYVNGVNKRSRTYVTGRIVGDNLFSDANGILQFEYFFDGNSTDQDIVHTFIGPQASQVTWATEAAASLTQPIQVGAFTCLVQAAGSSATFGLTVVAEADLILNTVVAAQAAISLAIANDPIFAVGIISGG